MLMSWQSRRKKTLGELLGEHECTKYHDNPSYSLDQSEALTCCALSQDASVVKNLVRISMLECTENHNGVHITSCSCLFITNSWTAHWNQTSLK